MSAQLHEPDFVLNLSDFCCFVAQSSGGQEVRRRVKQD